MAFADGSDVVQVPRIHRQHFVALRDEFLMDPPGYLYPMMAGTMGAHRVLPTQRNADDDESFEEAVLDLGDGPQVNALWTTPAEQLRLRTRMAGKFVTFYFFFYFYFYFFFFHIYLLISLF